MQQEQEIITEASIITCPLHDIRMIYVGRVPAWENRRLQAHAWHCSKCSIEIQHPITTETTTESIPS